jgi:hypothetical protein
MKSALDLLRADPNVAVSFKDAASIIDAATADLRADNDAARPTIHTHIARVREAVAAHKRRAAAPNPTVEITLDLGEFGEIPATVEYEGIPGESGDYYQPSTPAHLIIYSVIARDFGELLPGIERQHRDVLAGIKDKVNEKLHAGVRDE